MEPEDLSKFIPDGTFCFRTGYLPDEIFVFVVPTKKMKKKLQSSPDTKENIIEDIEKFARNLSFDLMGEIVDPIIVTKMDIPPKNSIQVKKGEVK